MFKKYRENERLDAIKTIEKIVGIDRVKFDAKSYNQIKSNTTISNSNDHSNSYESYNKEWVHDSEIIRNGWTNPNDARCREGMALFQSYGRANIYKVADAITRIPITINKKRQYKKNEDKEPHAGAMLFWDKKNMQNMLQDAIIACRTQGMCVYSENNEVSLTSWDNISLYKLRTMTEITYINSTKGKPQNIEGMDHVLNDQIPFTLKPTEYILFDPDHSKSKLGIPANWVIWDKLLSLECIGSSLEIFMERLGNGFLHADLPAGTPPEIRTKVQNAIKHLRSELGIYTESDKDNKATMNWVSPSSSVTFDAILTGIKNDIAVGAEFPITWFTDPSNAEISASVFHRLEEIAHKYDDFIKSVLIFHGIIDNFNEVEIDYHIGTPTLDLEKNQAAIAANSVIAGKTWLTPDEKRELDGYDPLPNAEGSMLNPLGKTNRVNTTNDPDKPAFPGQTSTTADQFDKKQLASETKIEQAKSSAAEDKAKSKTDTKSILKRMSESDLAELLGVSAGTVHKIKDNLTIGSKSSVVKCDSFTRVGNKIHFDNAVLLAPSSNLEYEDHIEIQSKEEIAAWYNADTPKEFHLGVEFAPNHNGSAEVPLSLSVGIIKADRLDSNGFVYGSGTIDLDKVDSILGVDNYVHEQLIKKEVRLSAGMRVKERFIDEKNIERTKLDIRSVMIVPAQRNEFTIIKEDSRMFIRGKNVVYAGKALGDRPKTNISVYPVSSNVQRMEWNASTMILTVAFQDGSIYDYDFTNIPDAQAEISKITKGMAGATTEGEANGVRWWVGKNPSFGAAVHQYLSTGLIPYTSR